MPPDPQALIELRGVTSRYGANLILRDINLRINRGDIFIIMGASGSGKSTLMRHMVGLAAPSAGEVRYEGVDLWRAEDEARERIMRRMGVTYQSGGLWGSMTLAENVALPLEVHTRLSPREIAELVSYKLSLVGLAGFENYTPSELSGGMQKRAGLARAMALDPDIMFFDEPSAGLDPISARRLDDLILSLRDNLGATVVIVTHELASIFAIGNNGVFLDPVTKTQIATGSPADMLAHASHPMVQEFLTRGKPKEAPHG